MREVHALHGALAAALDRRKDLRRRVSEAMAAAARKAGAVAAAPHGQ